MTGTIDSSTFKRLNPSNFYQDKRHVYRYFNMLDGGNFSILEDADPKTFKLLGDCYAKDHHHIYEERFGQLKDADYATFKSGADVGCVAKDKNGYWFWDERKSWDDLDSEERERVSVLEH
ncbi:DKNYY domain-containing protein [Acinetobacter bereziniae]|uniref:DKNYY domain-containing protein n=1 Tax=Acinetobacter bereziniae TaxID=106648 RepID=UPI0021E4AF64|nr:DKNYY domain-containing protein [Acinetobacter bereziniae]MCV2445475.1 DKNYY domain-containing protein [Acinetobacter bereziniae]